jgi:hypothetical protein
MKAADQHRVLEILDKVIPVEGNIEWKSIVKSVSAEMKITNWMDVRGILQYMISNKIIKRHPDVTIEAYTKLAK